MAALASWRIFVRCFALPGKAQGRPTPGIRAVCGYHLRTWRKVGYKNICKLLLGEATPEKLKGEG